MATITVLPSIRRRPSPSDNGDPRPCRSCGVMVRRPDPEFNETLVLPGQMTEGMRVSSMHPSDIEIPVTRCRLHAKRRAWASGILLVNPRVADAHGAVALDRLDAGLAALEIAGVRGRLVEPLLDTDEALHELMTDFASVGAAASWAVVARTVEPGKRWGHVTQAARIAASTKYRDLVHKLMDVPAPYGPPNAELGDVSGCLFCGRGTVVVRKADAADAWGERRSVRLAPMGEQRPGSVSGHLCPLCRESFEKEGALGTPAMSRAVLAHLGFTPRKGFSNVRFPGSSLRAFGALPVGTAPNRTPWQHLDLDGLTEKLSRSMYARRFTDRERRG